MDACHCREIGGDRGNLCSAALNRTVRGAATIAMRQHGRFQ
jgi:hypothetical protein